MEKLVTIITATYNLISSGRKEYIAQCFDSIHGQTYTAIEHLVIDGASTDGTLELLAPYEERGLITLISEPDTGIYNAYNKGIAKAKGDYIAFMNSDDFYARNDAIALCAAAIKDSNALYAFASNYILKDEDRKKKTYHPNLYRGVRSMPINHESMLLKKEYFERYGQYNEDYAIVADFDSYLKAFLDNATAVQIPEVITAFRHGGISTSDTQRVSSELAQVLYSNYHSITNCSLEHCKDIIKKQYFPTAELKQILQHANVKNKFPYLWYNYKYMLKSMFK